MKREYSGGRAAAFQRNPAAPQTFDVRSAISQREIFEDAFLKARAQQRPQGIKKGPRVNASGPFQRVCEDCGAHGQSGRDDPSYLWWHFPDALGLESLQRMIVNGPTHKIVGCGICGSHKLKGILFSDPLI